MSEKELSIKDMDFGEFLSPEDEHLTPPIPKAEEEKEEEEIQEEEIDVNVALAGQEDIEEKEDEEVSKEETEDKDETEPPASSDDEPFTLVLARYQLEQGVLSSLDEDKLQEIIKEEGEPAAFKYLIQQEVDSNIKAASEQLDNYSREYVELRKSGFASEDAANTVLTLEALDSISEEDLQNEEKEDLRRMILKENYKATTSFSESKIDRLVKRAFDIDADVEDAKEALESLREAKQKEIETAKEAQRKEQEANQEAYNRQIQDLNKHIESLEEIIPGKKINKQTKSKIFDLITKPVKQSDEGYSMNAIWAKRNEDPISFDAVMSYLYLSGVFEGKWDQITKSVNTKLTTKLEEKLKTGSGSSLVGGKHSRQRTKAEETRDNMIGPMKRLFGED
jgi:hypothetical protein